MDCVVIYVENGELRAHRKKWGLVTKSGTATKPLYNDEKDIIKMCFSNLCFNARSDTLFSKPTFSRLALRGNTCIVALDGYFEWKSSPLPKGNKQPYFVYRKEEEQSLKKREPLLMAGLWTRVSTGRLDTPELDSFAILTTESCKQIEWLHHRMPVCIWDMDLARKWLTEPSEKLKNQLDDAARLNNEGFSWHKVTPEMSKLQFRGKEAIAEMKETTKSVKHFFAPAGSRTHESSNDATEKAKKLSQCRNNESCSHDNKARGVEPCISKSGKYSAVSVSRNSTKEMLSVPSLPIQPAKGNTNTTKATTTPLRSARTKRPASCLGSSSKKQKTITSFFTKT
mmetsp:Transcript_10746/g.19774  ORF Transcript_10746/g.19774 Transcript_10746/m.19774 type:complete len:340 (+) Transcript_10746:2-1021(+)